jgi:hypothetical protein
MASSQTRASFRLSLVKASGVSSRKERSCEARSAEPRVTRVKSRYPRTGLVCDTPTAQGEFVMMPSRLVVLFCAALLGTACTTPASRTAVAPEVGSDMAADGGDLASAPAVAATAEEDPLVCEMVIRTGTRVAQRTCMRRSWIEKNQRDAEEMLGEVQKRGVQAGNQTKE